MNEATLTRKMKEVVRARGGYAAKINSNVFSSGIPDLVCAYEGVFLGLEVKVPGRENTVTKLQKANLDMIDMAGGIARVVTTTQQVEEILDEVEAME